VRLSGTSAVRGKWRLLLLVMVSALSAACVTGRAGAALAGCRCVRAELIHTAPPLCLDEQLKRFGGDLETCRIGLSERLDFSEAGPCRCRYRTLHDGAKMTERCLEQLATPEECFAFRDTTIVGFEVQEFRVGKDARLRTYAGFRPVEYRAPCGDVMCPVGQTCFSSDIIDPKNQVCVDTPVVDLPQLRPADGGAPDERPSR